MRLTKDTQVATAYNVFEDHKAGERIETTIGRITFNNVLPNDYPYLNYEMNKKEISRLVEDVCNRYELSDVPAILDGLKDAGFHYATRAGVTVSVYDATVPPNKGEILAKADAKVAAIDEDYEMGLMSQEERHKQVVDIWNEANEEVGEAMAENFDKFNPIYMMAFSGARGNIKQIRQLAGMRGLMSDPKGEIIDRPIKANFREGLSVLEYFISTHGARKGLADTALRTADSGYLTRRLVDVAQDVIIREIDCGHQRRRAVPHLQREGRPRREPDRPLPAGRRRGSRRYRGGGRRRVRHVHGPGEGARGRGHHRGGHPHGHDLPCRPRRVPEVLRLGPGHVASGQHRHGGGHHRRPVHRRAGHAADHAHVPHWRRRGARTSPTVSRASKSCSRPASPRARRCSPRSRAPCRSRATSSPRPSRSTTRRATTASTWVSARAQLLPGVSDGCEVKVGQQLTKGSVNPHDLLRLTDPNTTLRYIVGQVQGVYVSQGVDINDKHIEVIARQMLRKVAVMDAGDSDLLPGRQVNRFEFEKIANELIAEGKEPPVGQPLLLGITKASLATDSFLSAASFQETTKVLTDAAIEGKTDHLAGLKENVIIGKPIPAGTGLHRYRDVRLTYKGRPVDRVTGDTLPDFAPEALRDIEDLLPQPQDWSLDGEGYLNMGSNYGSYYSGLSLGHRGHNLSDEEARLYIYDDLGVSQRWANKFSEAGIETVADLVGHTEEDLLRIEGIGVKAIEELKEGLAERDLSHVIEDDLAATNDDMSQLLDMVFSPDDTILIGGDEPPTFDTSGEDMLGEALPPRSYQRNLEELDALLGSVGSFGFGLTSREQEETDDSEE